MNDQSQPKLVVVCDIQFRFKEIERKMERLQIFGVLTLIKICENPYMYSEALCCCCEVTVGCHSASWEIKLFSGIHFFTWVKFLDSERNWIGQYLSSILQWFSCLVHNLFCIFIYCIEVKRCCTQFSVLFLLLQIIV